MSILTRSTISKVIILSIVVVMVWSLASFNWNRPNKPTVRESYECIVKICSDLPGAGDACLVQKPKITKIIISEFEGAVTVQFTPTTDRCADGSD